MNLPSAEETVIIDALKSKYFTLLQKENIPKTPEITKQIDDLEKMINKMLPKTVELCN